MNAMRSRCAGSMFAWILNTKPASFSSNGSTTRVVASRGRGAGAWSTKKPSSSSTPKLLIAEPKNTGVWRAARYAPLSKAWVAPRTSSTSSRNAAASSPRKAAASAEPSRSIVRLRPARPSSAAS